jgi:Flp pilus assembly protein CpaB
MSRISPGTIIVGVFAVLFGLVGAYAVRQHLAKPEVVVEETPEPAPPPPLLVVPMASTDIEAGRPLTMGDIAVLRLSKEQVAEMKLPGNYMTVPTQIIGRVLREPVKQGDVFLTTQLYPENMLPTVAQRLKPGLRAVTVPMQDNGLASPGTVIDVIFRSSADVVRQRPQATVILVEGVEILAVGRNEFPGLRGEAAVPTTVTLAVTAQQANALKVVEGHGELSLAMRNPEDGDNSPEVQPLTLDTLLGFSTPAKHSTEIYRGTKRSENTFAEPEDEPMVTTSFPIGPDQGVPTAATSLTGLDGQPTAAKKATGKASKSQERSGKRGLSGLPLLSDAERQKGIDLVRAGSLSGAE